MVDPTLDDDGFVVLPGLLSDEQLAAAGRHADELLRGVVWSDNDFDGSAVVYSGRLWHAAGHNRSDATRRALICEHLVPWLRPADNHILATGVDGLLALSPQLRRLAGVAAVNQYFGFVAGRHPEQWLLDQANPACSGLPDAKR
jgi:hypothetical protein